jgi:GTP cyclohydrolase II
MPRSLLAPAASSRGMPGPSTAPTAFAALEPDGAEQLLRVVGDLRLGLPVVLEDGEDAALVALVETLTEARYRAMTSSGGARLALTRRRAEALGAAAPPHCDALQLPLPAGADAAWLAAVSGHDGSGPHGPGPVPPPVLHAGTPIHVAAIALARAAQRVPAVLTVPLGTRGRPGELLTLPVRAVHEVLDHARTPERVSSARLPMQVSEAGRVTVFRPDGGGAEHYAIEIGAPDPTEPVLVRLHSACFTGDVLGSLKCDCGPQLRAAMATMAAEGGGVLLYLAQEGRGIGLANKVRAYALQDAGLDTVQANHWLGFDDDQRDYRVGARLLRHLGIERVRLMTNNPAKVDALAAHGVPVVERVPLVVGRGAHNARYLATKAAKSGHLL